MACIKFKDFYALEDIQKLKYNAENEKKLETMYLTRELFPKYIYHS